MKRFLTIIFCALAISTHSADAAEKLRAVASFSILADMVQEIGGDAILLTTLVGRDRDAHAFEPAPRDAQALANADIVFVNGLGFEPWIGRLIAASGFHGRIVTASAGIAPLTLEGGEDPHAWQSVPAAERYAATIARALGEADPAHAALYAANAARYQAKLQTLDAWVRAQIAPIAPASRIVITTHDAFGYFGREYGVTFLSPYGLSSADEPKPAALARLSDRIREQHLHTLFIENIAEAKLLAPLAQESGTSLGGKLYSDALSAPDGPAGSYVELMRYNVTQLAAAMQENRP